MHYDVILSKYRWTQSSVKQAKQSHLYSSITVWGTCEYFFMFVKTPWAASTEDVSVRHPGAEGYRGAECATLLTINWI